MKKEFSRTDRFSQQMQREIAMILQREIKDPRVVMPTVNAVEVSRDLAYAKVYITFLQDDEEQAKIGLQVLNEASGYIRSLLGKRIKSRITPDLRFVLDVSLYEGIRMAKLVREARDRDEEKNNSND